MAKKKAPPEPPPSLRLEWRSPAELVENPANWRRHPEPQIAALTDVIAEVGWAGACLFNEVTGRLIDGHARRKVALAQGSDKVPVLVGSWTEEQERKILATLDPLAAMAEADSAALAALLASVETQSEALNGMLADLVDTTSILLPEPSPSANDVAGEWQGMPEFEHEDKTAYQRVIVHFKDQAAVERFASLVGQQISSSARFIWYPEIEIERHADKRYAQDQP